VEDGNKDFLELFSLVHNVGRSRQSHPWPCLVHDLSFARLVGHRDNSNVSNLFLLIWDFWIVKNRRAWNTGAHAKTRRCKGFDLDSLVRLAPGIAGV
jgi:hypothetical protein